MESRYQKGSCTEKTSWLICEEKISFFIKKSVDKIPREKARMKNFSAFDPRIDIHRQVNDVWNLFPKVQIINKNAFLFKSIETYDTTVCSDFSSLIIQNIKEKVLFQNTKTEEETALILLKNMSISNKRVQQLEKATRRQSSNSPW